MKTPWWFMHKTPLAFILVPVSWVYYLVGRTGRRCWKNTNCSRGGKIAGCASCNAWIQEKRKNRQYRGRGNYVGPGWYPGACW